MGLNQFSDLTDTEFRARHTMTEKIDRRGRQPSDGPWQFENIDIGVGTAVDWRDDGVVGPVQNQGNCGSCWAFAGVGASASTFALRGNNGTKITAYIRGSVQEVMDCCYPNQTQYCCLNCGGGEPVAMMGFIKDNHGLDAASDWPYVSGSDDKPRACDITKFNAQSSKVIKVDGGVRPPANNETALLQALSTRPITVDIDVAGGFRRYAGGVFTDVACGYSVCHATLLVGFNITGAKSIPGSPNATGYTVMQNSWGSTWGDKGYIRIATGLDYETNNKGLCTINSYPAMALLNETP